MAGIRISIIVMTLGTMSSRTLEGLILTISILIGRADAALPVWRALTVGR
jgi:hypothetical protein